MISLSSLRVPPSRAKVKETNPFAGTGGFASAATLPLDRITIQPLVMRSFLLEAQSHHLGSGSIILQQGCVGIIEDS
jgi:hypothetical protein